MKAGKIRKTLKGKKNDARPKRAKKARSDSETRRQIADAVKLYLNDKKISRKQFGAMVGRKDTTINHFFAGDFADSFLAIVEHALGRSFGRRSSIAPEEWGEYTQDSTAKFVGSYLTIRCDFAEPAKIVAYVTTLEWGEIQLAHYFDGKLVRKPKVDGHGLIFREERRVDAKHTHRGQVWWPNGQYLYLVTAYGDARLRAAIVSLPEDNIMAGIQLSLYNPIGQAVAPAASPIVFLKREKIEDGELGSITTEHRLYGDYRHILIEAQNTIKFICPP